ncbi:MAG: CoA transferase, partial [Candidatus Dormibacteraeota bacterium]|nr:CoA transferase [Candidatus Dormibacteraeota bacterium]
PELVADPRFDSPDGRFRNREQLNALIAERLRTRSSAEWVEVLNEVGVPAGPVYRVDEVFADPQVRHLRLTSQVGHPSLGRLDLVRNAVSTDREVETVRGPSPELGEHSSEVLAELGLTAAEIADLRRRGVV